VRSGIGPADSLGVVKASNIDVPTMIKSQDWIDLPVGKTLRTTQTLALSFYHPDIVSYDFYSAYTDPITADTELYLSHRGSRHVDGSRCNPRVSAAAKAERDKAQESGRSPTA
jgi:hypothetical protein